MVSISRFIMKISNRRGRDANDGFGLELILRKTTLQHRGKRILSLRDTANSSYIISRILELMLIYRLNT